jgi:hypothetical protein
VNSKWRRKDLGGSGSGRGRKERDGGVVALYDEGPEPPHPSLSDEGLSSASHGD